MSEIPLKPGAARRPAVERDAARELAQEFWGVEGEVSELPGYEDRNYRVGRGPEAIVLKVTDASAVQIELAAGALERVAEAGGGLVVGRAVRSLAGELWEAVEGEDGRAHRAWAVRWLEGTPLAHAGPRAPGLLWELGAQLGRARVALEGWEHEGLGRGLEWDLRRGVEVAWSYERFLEDPRERRTIREALAGIEVGLEGVQGELRVGVIHGDANDHNWLVRDSEPASGVCGLLDFGDIDRGWVLGEVAICAGYLMLEEADPVAACEEIVAGYHSSDPIPEEELEFLFDLARLRLCVSVTVGAWQRSQEPENEYLSVTTAPGLRLLRRLQRLDRGEFHARMARACGESIRAGGEDGGALLERRRRGALGPNLSLSYEEPLEIVRGEGRYLIERGGRSYLDGVNNVPQVGHCHPVVVEATTQQMRRLNTNTRYLSGVRMRFVERLLATLPSELEVVYLVNSGSEANELARRLVGAHTGGGDWIVLEGGYHGNTQALVELSHYKFNAEGGAGRAEHVRVAKMPDKLRGMVGHEGEDPAAVFAESVACAVAATAAAGASTAAFIAESLMGCAGQLVLPEGYLQECYRIVRGAGGLVIADEVQVGCGRVGSHWWGFETQGVVPDIVTMGKPLGNGHPLGAVVTTRAVAESFDNGMEFFSTFGGNPVSCAAGEAVLRVIEEEGLMQSALETGCVLMDGLRAMQGRYECIGDVRGLGLCIGLVCVRERGRSEPDAGLASAVVERMKQRRVLLSTDGIFHDVIKIKPPLVFGPEDALHLLEQLECAFAEALVGGSR